MNTKYGYFLINRKLPDIWDTSRIYWRSQKNMFIKHDTSYMTDKFGKIDLSKRRSFKQSEEYKISLARDPNDPNITYARVFFEYYGDAFIGASKRMENTINEWICQFNLAPISFHRNPLKEYEVFFSDIVEEYQIRSQKSKELYCIFCGKKLEKEEKICQFCGSNIE